MQPGPVQEHCHCSPNPQQDGPHNQKAQARAVCFRGTARHKAEAGHSHGAGPTAACRGCQPHSGCARPVSPGRAYGQQGTARLETRTARKPLPKLTEFHRNGRGLQLSHPLREPSRERPFQGLCRVHFTAASPQLNPFEYIWKTRARVHSPRAPLGSLLHRVTLACRRGPRPGQPRGGRARTHPRPELRNASSTPAHLPKSLHAHSAAWKGRGRIGSQHRSTPGLAPAPLPAAAPVAQAGAPTACASSPGLPVTENRGSAAGPEHGSPGAEPNPAAAPEIGRAHV